MNLWDIKRGQPYKSKPGLLWKVGGMGYRHCPSYTPAPNTSATSQAQAGSPTQCFCVCDSCRQECLTPPFLFPPGNSLLIFVCQVQWTLSKKPSLTFPGTAAFFSELHRFLKYPSVKVFTIQLIHSFIHLTNIYYEPTMFQNLGV